MTRIFVKPVEGRRVKDPRTRELLRDLGAWVPKDSYWTRRIKDGDVTVTDGPAAKRTEVTRIEEEENDG